MSTEYKHMGSSGKKKSCKSMEKIYINKWKTFMLKTPNSSMNVLSGTNHFYFCFTKLFTVLHIQMFADHSESLLLHSFLIYASFRTKLAMVTITLLRSIHAGFLLKPNTLYRFGL